MYRVGVCDDERILAEHLCTLLSQIFEARGVTAEIRLFLSGEELLHAAPELDIAFLDIDMPQLDGIETGKRLRKQNPSCRIVMVSAMESRMKEGYVIRAQRFVTKPVDPAELSEAVDALLAEDLGTQTIRLFFENQAYEIRQNRIDYVEAYNGYTLFHVNGRAFRREENLKFFADCLDPRLFARISRKHIVNLKRVSAPDLRGSLHIEGETLPVSRRLREELKRRYTEYDLNYGGLA